MTAFHLVFQFELNGYNNLQSIKHYIKIHLKRVIEKFYTHYGTINIKIVITAGHFRTFNLWQKQYFCWHHIWLLQICKLAMELNMKSAMIAYHFKLNYQLAIKTWILDVLSNMVIYREFLTCNGTKTPL